MLSEYTIKVLGLDYKILFVEEVPTIGVEMTEEEKILGLLGNCNSDDHIIYIANEVLKNGKKAQTTLWHELIHAITIPFTTNNCIHEEIVSETIAIFFPQILSDCHKDIRELLIAGKVKVAKRKRK